MRIVRNSIFAAATLLPALIGTPPAEATAPSLSAPAVTNHDGQPKPEDPRGEPGRLRQRGEGPRFKNGFFDALDVNSDSALDYAEIGRAADFLRKFDRNGDGQISQREVFHEVGHFRIPSERLSAILFHALDANGDRMLDRAELERIPDVLRKRDKDGDGRISPEEVRAVYGPAPA